MNILLYILVFAGSFLVDVIPFVGPPAWIVMVFLHLQFNLDIWLVLLVGVTGSALGRYVYSIYIKRLAIKYINEQKTADLLFVGTHLAKKGWRVQLFILLYTLIPVPTTPLFTASGLTRIRPLHIMPAFFAGKLVSNGFMITTGKYVALNLSALPYGMLSWQSMAGTGGGILLISLFFFTDWQKLLTKKTFSLNFRIWNGYTFHKKMRPDQHKNEDILAPSFEKDNTRSHS